MPSLYSTPIPPEWWQCESWHEEFVKQVTTVYDTSECSSSSDLGDHVLFEVEFRAVTFMILVDLSRNGLGVQMIIGTTFGT